MADNADATSVATETSVSTPEAASPASPEQTAAAEREALTAEFNKGLEDWGFKRQAPNGMKYHPKSSKQSKEETPTEAPKVKAETKPEPAPVTEPTEPTPQDETPAAMQRRLSSGFAKLARYEKQDAKRKSELKELEAKLNAEKESVTKAKDTWQQEQAEKLELVKLLDQDELAFLDGVAKRKGVSRQALYDKITRAFLNDGKRDPADIEAELSKKVSAAEEKAKAELEALSKKHEELQNELKQKEQASLLAQKAAEEKSGFVSWVTESVKDQYPHLSAEPADELAEVAYQVGVDYAKATGKPATFEMVADHLEKHLAFVKFTEAQKMAAKPDSKENSARGNGAATKTAKPEPASKPKPAAESKPHSAPVARTLNNLGSSLRISSTGQAPRKSDAQRMSDAIDMWTRR